eukprot:s444_g49.t1
MLHGRQVYAYVTHLACIGQMKIVLGGPPCRTFSRLRHQRPGPMPLRGRGEKRWRWEIFTEEEMEKVHGDSALVLKMMALYDLVAESPAEKHAFLMEHPSDPEDYLSDTQEQEYPSVWEWPEVIDFAQRHNLHKVKLEQGACGHQRVKPTTLLTDLSVLKELDGMKANGPNEELKLDLGARMKQTSTWSAWAPALVKAIQTAIMQFQDAAPQVKKFSIVQWQQHVRQNHVPSRRDCRLCIEEMGQDLPHRRRRGLGGESVYVVAVDVAGPFAKGDGLGAGQKARYALVATAPIPLGIAKKDLGSERPSGDCHSPGVEPGCEDLERSQDLGGSQVLGSPEAFQDLKNVRSLLMPQLLKELRYQGI